ncbi:methyltransferase domain-containing protein [Streptomyces spectabilis]|uniref:SAM-dependent methyltransferase n=1 Tax=Streptomyces spectabilis TaxID=68270 RepID=A0A7W8EX96_STRST|nr:methyltransferase domain-containing protein [Streptomyces spectabilis]MBB5106814.1 SAM-dependent methyltransferase [Streptomyces spectabilis]MCI3903335.1 methyltransferase domain-containing protein [Streptomyces spectabilis]
MTTTAESTLSHHTPSSVDSGAATARRAAEIEARLRADEARLLLPLDRELALLAELQEFEFGRFLLHNEGLNGYWTSYVFQYEPGDPTANDLERWLLTKSLMPGIRERFHRFKAHIAPHVTDGAVLASVPCGLMDDLLQQDYTAVAPGSGLRLIGADIDAESVESARARAAARGLADVCEFHVRDAWQLGLDGEVDLLTSNGLNMYEPDRARLVELYRNFARALRVGGRLLVSFIPAPPAPPWAEGGRSGDWDRYGIHADDLRQDLAIFGDILQAKYLNFTSEQEIREQLAEAGLTVTGISYSDTGVLPVATAVRRH